MLKQQICILALALFAVAVSAAPQNELVDISSLDQFPKDPYNFKMYSGYLMVDNSTEAPRKLFYVLTTSENNETTDPLLLWFNGGPGCSSLDGFAYEHGPWVFNLNTTTLRRNKYAWNRNANVLYLESFAVVGFSRGPDIEYNDTITAEDNVKAMIEFYKKFPEFKSNDFYISGESYAGIYVPTLALGIDAHNKIVPEAEKMNLKGFAVGNPVTSVDDLARLILSMNFLGKHNMMSPQDWRKFEDLCDDSKLNTEDNIVKCVEHIQEVYEPIYSIKPINHYNILEVCFNDTVFHLPDGEVSSRQNAKFFHDDSIELFARLGLDDKVNPFAHVPACTDAYGATMMFNNKTVRDAFHVDGDKTWVICVHDPKYKRKLFTDFVGAYAYMLRQGYRIMLFSGDNDLVCNIDGSMDFIGQLSQELDLPADILKTPWHMPGNYDDEPQVAGYFEEYGNFRFVQVKGAGHMVPIWAPKEGLHVINTFLMNERLN